MNNTAYRRAYLVLAMLLLANLYWLWLTLSAPPTLTANAEQTKQNPAAAKAKPVSITPAPKAANVPPQKPSAAPAKKTSPAATVAKKQTSKKNEPRLIGEVNVDYFTLERTINQLGGGVFLYDINQRKTVRQINQGVLISTKPSKRPLSIVSHNITSELEKDRVDSWVKEQRQFIPNGQFVVVAKLPTDYQTGFEQFVKMQAAQHNTDFNKIDEVRFNFTAQGLVLREFFIDGKIIAVNQPYRS